MTIYHDHQDEFNDRIADEMHQAHDQQQHQSDTHRVDEHNEASWLSSTAHFLGHIASEVAAEAIGEFASGIVLGSHGHDTDVHDHPVKIGEPNGSGWHHQEGNKHCAVACQKMIMDRFELTNPQTGNSWTEQELIDLAKAEGWFQDGGTNLHDFGKLLESQGIDCHVGHTWPQMIHDLAAGHQVAIAVQADEVGSAPTWMSFIREILPGRPNHAVILKGMETDNDNRAFVVINDPDMENGAGLRIPVARFQSALGGGWFQYIATDAVPPQIGESDSHDLTDHGEPSFNNLSQEDRNSFLKDL